MVFVVASIFKSLLGRNDEPNLKGLSGDLRKQVRKLHQDGDFLAAGELLFQNAHYEAAAVYFSEARNPARAAEAQELAGNGARAIALYKKAGNRVRAGEIWGEMGQFEAAALEMLAAGLKERAADYYARGTFYRKAGELYQELGQHLKAAKAFQDAGDTTNQMEMFAQAFDIEFDIARGNLKLIGATRAMAAQAAQHYISTPDGFERGLQLYLKAGYPDEAAKALAQSGRYADAAKLFEDANNFHEAAAHYDSAAMPSQAAQARARALLMEGDSEQAAALLINAGLLERAADIYIDLQQPAKAAVLFIRMKKFIRAAELYEKGGDLEKAAKAYEAGKAYARAAELFAKLNDHAGELRASASMEDFYRVGRILVSLEKLDESVEALKRVEPSDPRYQEAMELQGDVLWRRKQHNAAYHAYRNAFGDSDPNASNIQLLYKMGRCLENQGDPANATQTFQQVMRVDPAYRDVAVRIGQLAAAPANKAVGSDGITNRAPSAMLKRRARPSNPRLVPIEASSPVPHRPMSGTFSPPTPMSVPAAPQAQQRFEIIEEIARGGMGIVYQAHDILLSRTVALKVLSKQLRDNDTAKEYFLREARAAAQLQHPNIVTIFDIGRLPDGEVYLAMEYIEGKTLKQIVSKEGPLPEKFILQILAHACRGLQYAHDRSVVHRDIKSGNIMLARTDRSLKILDFGLAKVLTETQNDHTQAIGTPFYMSPEQILGNELDHRSDLYSLGVTMFELATGTVPFFKGDLPYKHVHEEPPAPRSLNPAIGVALETIILKCMRKAPKDRYGSCNDIIKDIRSLQA